MTSFFIFVWMALGMCLISSTHYRTLQVPDSAKLQDIRKAYRTLAIEYHPDKIFHNASDLEKEVAKNKFLAIQTAYEILSDDYRRRVYDESLLGGPGFHNEMPVEEYSPYSSGSFFTVVKTRRIRLEFYTVFPKKSLPEIVMFVGVEPRVFFYGDVLNRTYYIKKKCRFCNGSGSADGICSTCDACNGTGVNTRVFPDSAGATTSSYTQATKCACSHCHGKGCSFEKRCSYCGGSGLHFTEQWMHIIVLAGFNDQQEYLYETIGHEDLDGTKGNLRAVLHYELPPGYKISESNRYCLIYNTTLGLSKFQPEYAFDLPVIDGAEVRIKMPANITAAMLLSGLQFHFRCRGLLFEQAPWLVSRTDAAKVEFVEPTIDVSKADGLFESIGSSSAVEPQIEAMGCRYRGDLHINLQVDWSLSTLDDLRAVLGSQDHEDYSYTAATEYQPSYLKFLSFMKLVGNNPVEYKFEYERRMKEDVVIK